MGNLELLVILLVGLLVIGPERLPETVRSIGLWMGRLRRSFNSIKSEIEKEVGMDEIRRQLHNEAVMEEMKRIEQEVQNTIQGPDLSNPFDGLTPPENKAGASDTPSDAQTGETPTEDTSAAGADAAAQGADETEQQTHTVPPSTPANPPDAPAPPLPRSEAELEAYHARKARTESAPDV